MPNEQKLIDLRTLVESGGSRRSRRGDDGLTVTVWTIAGMVLAACGGGGGGGVTLTDSVTPLIEGGDDDQIGDPVTGVPITGADGGWRSLPDGYDVNGVYVVTPLTDMIARAMEANPRLNPQGILNEIFGVDPNGNPIIELGSIRHLPNYNLNSDVPITQLIANAALALIHLRTEDADARTEGAGETASTTLMQRLKNLFETAREANSEAGSIVNTDLDDGSLATAIRERINDHFDHRTIGEPFVIRPNGDEAIAKAIPNDIPDITPTNTRNGETVFAFGEDFTDYSAENPAGYTRAAHLFGFTDPFGNPGVARQYGESSFTGILIKDAAIHVDGIDAARQTAEGREGRPDLKIGARADNGSFVELAQAIQIGLIEEGSSKPHSSYIPEGYLYVPLSELAKLEVVVVTWDPGTPRTDGTTTGTIEGAAARDYGTYGFEFYVWDGQQRSQEAQASTLNFRLDHDGDPDAPVIAFEGSPTIAEETEGAQVQGIELVVRDADSDPSNYVFDVSDNRFEVRNTETDFSGDWVLRLREGRTVDHEEAATISVDIKVSDGPRDDSDSLESNTDNGQYKRC